MSAGFVLQGLRRKLEKNEGGGGGGGVGRYLQFKVWYSITGGWV